MQSIQPIQPIRSTRRNQSGGEGHRSGRPGRPRCRLPHGRPGAWARRAPRNGTTPEGILESIRTTLPTVAGEANAT
eukprot:11174913-Lingulodinium_polyedra.AAC.1